MSDNRWTWLPRSTDIASGTIPQNNNHGDSREIESRTDINDNRIAVFPRIAEIGNSEFDNRNISQPQNREVRVTSQFLMTKRVHLNENSKHGEGRTREKRKREDTPYGCKPYHMTIPPSDLQIVTVRRLQKRHLPAQ
jgi:hypothetical protein